MEMPAECDEDDNEPYTTVHELERHCVCVHIQTSWRYHQSVMKMTMNLALLGMYIVKVIKVPNSKQHLLYTNSQEESTQAKQPFSMQTQISSQSAIYRIQLNFSVAILSQILQVLQVLGNCKNLFYEKLR